jgi:methionine aminopeptidase
MAIHLIPVSLSMMLWYMVSPINELKEGDIISVDAGVILNGWHGDHAYTFAIGDPGNEVMKLIQVTKESLV